MKKNKFNVLLPVAATANIFKTHTHTYTQIYIYTCIMLKEQLNKILNFIDQNIKNKNLINIKLKSKWRIENENSPDYKNM